MEAQNYSASDIFNKVQELESDKQVMGNLAIHIQTVFEQIAEELLGKSPKSDEVAVLSSVFTTILIGMMYQ